MCCYIIITLRSLLWTLLTIITMLLILSAILTPKWLVGPPRLKTHVNSSTQVTFHDSLGLYNRCRWMKGRRHCGSFAVDGLLTDNEMFPQWWKAALFFLCVGLTILSLTVLSSVISCCVQSVFKKSIFTISGAAQAVAGIFFILGIMLYPAAWGYGRVHNVCGKESLPFYLGDCSLGWAFFAAVGGTALTFICSMLSVLAEVATSSDRVQFKIHQGNTLICLP